MDIEEVAANNPDAIIRTEIEPQVGLTDFQAREIAFKLDLPPCTCYSSSKNF